MLGFPEAGCRILELRLNGYDAVVPPARKKNRKHSSALFKKRAEKKRPRRRRLRVLETISVIGTAGNVYDVKVMENGKARCPCKGFRYRSQCRHLLDPEVVPALAHTDILVEIHGSASSNTLSGLETRFGGTHDMRIAEKLPRFPELVSSLIGEDWGLEMSEPIIAALAATRGYNSWAFFEAR